MRVKCVCTSRKTVEIVESTILTPLMKVTNVRTAVSAPPTRPRIADAEPIASIVATLSAVPVFRWVVIEILALNDSLQVN